jgi:hypothetical protein
MQILPVRATLDKTVRREETTMFRRRRPLMRAAVVGGVAYHVGKNVQGGRDEQAQQEAEQDARLDQVEGAQGAPAPAAGLTEDAMNQLKQLADLKTQGVLTDAEFEAQKQKILAAS